MAKPAKKYIMTTNPTASHQKKKNSNFQVMFEHVIDSIFHTTPLQLNIQPSKNRVFLKKRLKSIFQTSILDFQCQFFGTYSHCIQAVPNIVVFLRESLRLHVCIIWYVHPPTFAATPSVKSPIKVKIMCTVDICLPIYIYIKMIKYCT